jgi:catechol 2,3-dioxygenase-like lactoylglutathione lyase family enzyme
MKIRLHEIELGASDVTASTRFYQSLFGLAANVQQNGLTVFDAGVNGIDLNVSEHLPAGIAAISFLTDDLEEIQQRLAEQDIAYDGPFASHLEMTCLQFKSPDGYVVRVNTPGKESPKWMKI